MKPYVEFSRHPSDPFQPPQELLLQQHQRIQQLHQLSQQQLRPPQQPDTSLIPSTIVLGNTPRNILEYEELEFLRM